MQTFKTDLHIHSRFSRATSPKLTAHHLSAWAKIKGLDVIGTGDITHPAWRDELKEKLVFDDNTGLYILKNAVDIDHELPNYSGVKIANQSFFMLQGELSSIYKKGGKVRKVHNLVYFPNFEAADKFSNKLATLGNINSDGRPIVGLDSKIILEMVLESHPDSFLVPAHIWTPWFSIFGSKSGFDNVAECFGDLSEHIFALETGLSSDPEMNRLISGLDRFKLISNSDAHSGENLGREANIFSGEISYQGILSSLRDKKTETSPTSFLGTLEFFPEEGKYHLDGHRSCNIVMEPAATKARGGLCPVCGKALTVGVLHRIMELADRETPVFNDGTTQQSLIPLPELISEVVGTGPKSRRVSDMHARLISRFGSELSILSEIPEDEITRFSAPLGEAITRMRHGAVLREGGYDGEYGIIRVFSEKEQKELLTRGSVIGLSLESIIVSPICPHHDNGEPLKKNAKNPESSPTDSLTNVEAPSLLKQGETPKEMRFNVSQKRAVCSGVGPTIIIAGPGSGKTRTLVGRILHLIENSISVRSILAITFTRRAASDIDKRLVQSLGTGVPLPRTDTLYALAYEVWHHTHKTTPVLLSEKNAERLFIEANAELNPAHLKENFSTINLLREQLKPITNELQAQYQNYCRQKVAWNLVDFTELLEHWHEQMIAGNYSPPWGHVLVDELQDMSTLQLSLIKALMPPDGIGFFGVGDPDQAIYTFKGAHDGIENFMRETWPQLTVLNLDEHYRATPGLFNLATGFFKGYSSTPLLHLAGVSEYEASHQNEIRFFQAPNSEAEAIWIATQMKALLGLNQNSLSEQLKEAKNSYSLSEIAVLLRTKTISAPIEKALHRAGIPYCVPQTEAFWADPRVDKILTTASRQLGIAISEETGLNCPEKVISKGPLCIAAFFSNTPPFDTIFWQSSAFKALVHAFDQHAGWSGLINWISLQNELELVKNYSDKVQIMTVHQSKGFEFKAVFIPGLEDGLFPFMGDAFLTGHLKTGGITMNINEERRLFYVALSRVQELLFLSTAAKRSFLGHELRLKASKFINELPQENIVRSALKAHNVTKETQLKLIS